MTWSSGEYGVAGPSWKAVREVFPDTCRQRCWFHRQANVPAARPKSAPARGVGGQSRTFNNAEDVAKAQVAIKAFEVDYGS